MDSKNGIKELMATMDKEIKGSKSFKIQRQAINSGAKKVADKIESKLGSYVGTKYSTGATRDEIVIKEARKLITGVQASVGWNGTKQRYRLIHLNEFGYTRRGKKIKPRMYHLVTNTIKKTESEYFNTVYLEMKKGYGL